MSIEKKRKVVSLFSSAGIGELGLSPCGMDVVLSNELLSERCSLYRENYPHTESICGDIWEKKDDIISSWKKKNKGSPFLLYATPPCQGMSFNGIGKLLAEVRLGNRPSEDPRNRLIIPTVEIIKSLRPKWVLLENVPTMMNTVIRTEQNSYVKIVDYILEELAPDYVGKAAVVNCADYGIPQTRTRLITILTRDSKGKKYFCKKGSFLPETTHSEHGGDGKKKWITLKKAIGNFAALSAKTGENQDSKNYWHVVPVMKEDKFWWVQNTPACETAYNNQCSSCGFSDNPKHGMCFVDGRHQSKKDTPIYCEKCGALLPRPTMIDKKTGNRRLIKGFDSAYRRMSWNAPAPTLTQNFQFEASDKKLHPSQHRVLSVYEAMCLQTISKYSYKFSIGGTYISRGRCCEVIGESVPPFLIELICRKIISISEGENVD